MKNQSLLEQDLRRRILQTRANIQKLQENLNRRNQAMGFVSGSLTATPRPMGAQASYNPDFSGKLGDKWWMGPGSISQMNKTVWDYLFVTPMTQVQPNKTVSTSITINQVASFVWVEMCKIVFNEAGNYTWLDPDASSDIGFAPGLTLTLQNISSSQLYTNAPLSIDQIGGAQEPYKLPTPVLLPPQSAIGVNFSNSSSSTYDVQLALMGYRIDIPGALNTALVSTG